MKTRVLWFLPVLIFGFVVTGCSPKAKYDRRLKKELASGVRNDSIFMGIYFGMSQIDFYTHCWTLNKHGLIRQGPSNSTVECQLNKELKYPAAMNFYPTFENGKIVEMPVEFKYTGWAPWNKKLSADSLQADVLSWYKKKYGEDFLEVRSPKHGIAWVNISGNRRITIFKQDDMKVWAYFTDMLVKHDQAVVPPKNQITPGDSAKVPLR
jgi:hypothetical protein